MPGRALRWSRRATACAVGLAVLLVPASIAVGATADSQAGAVQAKPAQSTKPKPKPKPTKPKPKPVTAPRNCTPIAKPAKPKPARPAKPAKPAKGTKRKPVKKPSKPAKKPAPRPLRTCPAPAKDVPAYVPTTIGSDLGATEANGGNHGWAKLGGSLDAASTFTSPTGKGTTSIRMLDAPAATRTDYQNGAAYVTSAYTAIQVFRDRSMKESIVVPKRIGTKTWSWQLASSGALRPQLTPSGAVDLRNGLFIPAPEVTTADGTKLKAPAIWTLTPSGRLSLTTNDASYPLPYIVDPGVTPTGAFTGFSAASGNTYIDPSFSLTRIFINSSQNGQFTVNASVNDPDDALQTQVCFPVYGSGWTQDGGCVPGSSGASNPGILATYFSGSTTNNLAPYPGSAFTTTNYGTNPGSTTCANQPSAVGPFSRIEPTVDSYANWGTPGINDDSPYNELCDERFSARWQGTIRTPNESDASDLYYFSTISDDGIRVSIDGVVVLADWGEHGPSWRTSCAVSMAPNTVHSITVDYFENGSNNRAQMRWSIPGVGGRPPAATLCQTNDAARDKYLRVSSTNAALWVPTGQTTTATTNGTAPATWPVVPSAPTATSPGLRMPSNSFARTYAWTAGATAPPSTPQDIVFEDQAAPDPTPGTAPFTVIADGAGPVGGSIGVSAPAGGGRTTTPGAITVSWNANGTTDGAVGLSSGIDGTGEIWRQDVAYDNGNDTCDAFPSTWVAGNSTSVRSSIATNASVTNDATLRTSVISGRCYRWALVFTDNVGNVGAVASQVVRVDTTAPTGISHTITPVTGAAWMYASGSTLFYNNSGSNTGSFTIDATANDLESGMDTMRFPPVGGGWTPSGVVNDNSAPYSQTYSWTNSSSAATGMQLQARDLAGNSASGTAYNFTPDVTAPTGGAITYIDGVWGSTTYNVGFNVGADGTGSGVGSWYVERRETTLPLSGTCDPFVAAWTPVGGANPGGTSFPDSIVADHCYMYRLVVTDRVGNVRTFTSTNVLKFDEQPPVAAFFDLSATTGEVYRTPLTNRIWFNPASAGGFRMRATATDTIGMDRVTFPALGGTGWTGPTPADILAPSGGYWVSSPFAWSAGASDPAGPHQIVARDTAGNTTSVPVEVDADSTPPSGGLASPPNLTTNAATITVSTTPATDTQSGLRSYAIDMQVAPLVNGACGTWGAWTATGIAGTGTPPATSTYPSPATGCYRARLQTTDNVGNTEIGAASTNVLRVDKGNPSVAFTSPADNSDQSGTFSFNGTASENQTTLASVAITYAGPASGTACAAATLTPGTPGAWTWTCSWVAGALPDGLYTLTATATDTVGNSTTSTWHYRLDNQPPTASWVSWTENSSALHAGTGANRDLLWYRPAPTTSADNGTATATVSATDAGSGMNRVEFPALGAAGWSGSGNDTTATGTNYSFDYTFNGAGTVDDPADGTAVAFDNAGASTGAPGLGFRIQPDSAAPTGSSLTMPAALQSGVTMTASAAVGTDAGGSGVASWRVDYRFAELVDGTCGAWEPWDDGGGIPGFNGTASDGSTVSLNIRIGDANADGVPDVAESLCFQTQLFTIDNVGNIATGPLSGIRRMDFGNPTTSVSVPTSGSGTINVTGTASDARALTAPNYLLTGSGLDQVQVTYELPDGPDADALPDASGTVCTTTTFTGPWTARAWTCSWNTSSLPDGTYTVRATARDAAGRTSTIATGTVLLDNQAPISAWHSWNDNGSPYMHATGTVAWVNPNAPVGTYALDARFTAYDLGSGMDRVDVPAFGPAWTPSAAGGATYTAPSPAANGWTRALTFTNPGVLTAPGVVTATARDNAGNTSTFSFEARLDANAPSGGTATVVAGLQNSSSVSINLGAAVEPALESGLASWLVQYDSAPLANDVCGTFTNVWSTAATGVGIAPATLAHDVTLLPDGCYRYRVQTTDNVGNVGSSAASVARRVDRTLPTVSLLTPLNGSAQSGTFAVSGSAGDAHSGVDHVTLTWIGPASATGTICANATMSGSSPTWNYTCSWNTSALPDGSYTIRARSYDRASNVSTNTDIVVLLDNQPPYLGFHSFTETSPYTYWAGPVGTNRSIWFNPTAPAGTHSFDVNVISYDLGSGVDRVEFAGAGTGWTPGGSAASDTTSSGTPVANSYSATYTFDTGNGGLVDPPTIGITAFDPANNPSNTDFEVLSDNTAPNSGSLTYTDGFVPSTSVSIGVATGTDGAGSGVASWRLLRDSGTLAAGSCGSWLGYVAVSGANGTGVHTGTASDTVTDGGCFRYRLETTDNVGNVGVVTATEVIRVDLTPPTGSIVLAPNANPAGQYLASPTRLFVNTNQAGSFDANVTAGAASGVLDVAFPVIATSFSPAVTQPGPGTAFSRTYSWTAAAGTPAPPQQVQVRSQSLGNLNVPFEVIGDNAGPTGTSTTYASGFTSGTSVSVAFSPGTDGTGSGVASWQLQRDTGTLAAGACTWNNAWAAAGPASDAGPFVESPLAQATCYRFRVQSTDRVGNVSTSTAGGAVMVDQTAPTGATVTLAAATNPTAQYLPAGDSIWVNSTVAGSFTATVAATDPESGTGAATFPTLGTGWANGGSGATITYSWTAGAAAPVTPNVVVANGSGLTTSIPFTVQLDGAAPAGATLDQENGFVTDFLVDTTFAGGTDAGSGILSWRFERRSAPYAVGTDTCSPWSAWSAYPAPTGHPTSPYVDSSVTQPNCYQYRLVETDRVGNVQTTLDNDTAKVIDDIFPPAAFNFTAPPVPTLPTITTAAAAPACGAVPTYTTNTPLIDWTDSSDAQSGLADYRVHLDGASTPLGTVTAPTSSWTASTLSDGAHTIGVRAYDNQSNYTNHTAPYPAAIRVDSAAPNATLTTPADLAWTTDTTPTLSWNATDANCVARVEVYVDDMVTPVAVASGSETSWTPSAALAEGTHTWRVEAIDGAGRRTSSSTRTVGIDTVAPDAFAITTPSGATTVRGFIDVAWGASADAGSGLATLTAYTVYIDGIARTTVGAGTTTATISGITNGAHTLEVRATDAVGNVTTTASVAFTGYPAILPPVLDTPAAGAALNAVPTLDWHWVSDGGPAPTDYDVQVDGVTVGNVSHPTSDLAIADPTDGTHTWRIIQHDAYTGTVQTATRTFLLDRTAPVAPATLSRVATTISWAAATDPAAPVASGVQNVRFQIDGVTVATLAAGATSYNYGALPDGNYVMRLLVTDNAGNTSLSGTLAVTNDSVPPTAFTLDAPAALPTLPAITEGAAAPACGSAATYVTATPALTWQPSSDATSGLDGYTVLIDGAVVGTTAAGVETFTPSPALTGGAHTWQVVARDVFGLTRTSTPAPMNVRVDGAAPTIALGTPAANGFTSDTTPTLSWNGSDDNCLARAEVTLDGGVVAVLTGSASSWTPATLLSEGAHTWSIRVLDSAGNATASATRTLTIDTTAPTGITATNPVHASTTPEGMLTFSWSAGSDGTGSGVATYDLLVDGTPRATNLAAPTFGPVAIHAGAHTWRVRVVDQVGNDATFDFSFTASVVPDVTAPDPFDLLTPANAATIPTGTALTWAPAWDFNGVAQYRVYIDGALTGSTAGNVTSFTPAVGAGSAICSVDFDPATAAACVNTPQFSNGKAGGSATVLPSPASTSWAASSFAGWTSSGGAFGIGNPTTNTGWDGDRTWTAMDYQVAVPSTGADLRFEHRYLTQRVGNNAYDGGTLELMVDTAGDGFGNDTWASTCAYGTRAIYGATFDCAHEVVEVDGGYDAVLEGPAANNALPYRNVFSGNSGGMKQTRVRLDAFAGKNIRVRFKLGGDACYTGRAGCAARAPRPAIWHIDQLTLANKSLLPGLHTWNIVAVDPAGNTRASNQTWTFNLS